jgi:hypothetical protein
MGDEEGEESERRLALQVRDSTNFNKSMPFLQESSLLFKTLCISRLNRLLMEEWMSSSIFLIVKYFYLQNWYVDIGFL